MEIWAPNIRAFIVQKYKVSLNTNINNNLEEMLTHLF